MLSLLADAESFLRVGTAAEQATAAARAYLPDQRCVGWHGPVPAGRAIALDAELTAAPVPATLARRYGEDEFWTRWTRAEALCKLAGVPIAVWLRRHGLDAPAASEARWRTLLLADLTVTVALR